MFNKFIYFYLYVFVASIAIETDPNQATGQAPLTLVKELSGILSSPQSGIAEKQVDQVFEIKKLNPVLNSLLWNHQFDTYLQNHDLEFHLQFTRYKFHPYRYTSES